RFFYTRAREKPGGDDPVRAVLDLVERHGRANVELVRGRARARELTRERHGEAGGMRGSEELLRARVPIRLLDAGRKRVRQSCEGSSCGADRPVAARDVSLPGDVCLPLYAWHYAMTSTLRASAASRPS